MLKLENDSLNPYFYWISILSIFENLCKEYSINYVSILIFTGYLFFHEKGDGKNVS
ncbi:MAG: hypothetical protein JG768_1411 [Fusobacteriales bacterium]|nr:hypothetical protein [Fusobacteriales bacterium]